jgi:hypothetical protein
MVHGVKIIKINYRCSPTYTDRRMAHTTPPHTLTYGVQAFAPPWHHGFHPGVPIYCTKKWVRPLGLVGYFGCSRISRKKLVSHAVTQLFVSWLCLYIYLGFTYRRFRNFRLTRRRMMGFRYLPGRNDENDANISDISPCPNRDSTHPLPDLLDALPFQQTGLAVKVLVPTESVHTFRHLGKLLNCRGFRCTATGWFVQMWVSQLWPTHGGSWSRKSGY